MVLYNSMKLLISKKRITKTIAIKYLNAYKKTNKIDQLQYDELMTMAEATL